MNSADKQIFTYELSRLHDDYERCENKKIKKQIFEDITTLEKALQMLLHSS